MKHTSLLFGFAVTGIVTIVFSQALIAATAVLQIELRDSATVRSTQVLLGDVAELTCKDTPTLARAEQLELRLLDLTRDSEEVTAMSISLRLVLAGWSVEEFSITGSKSVTVTFKESELLTDADIEQEALRAMQDMLGVDEKDLTVHLQNMFVQSLKEDIRERDGLHVKVIPPRRGLGMVMMQIQIWKDKEMLATRTAAFDVRKRHRVAVARTSLSREIPIGERGVQFENRFLGTEMDELEEAQVIGQHVRANVVAGSILQMRDLQTSRTGGRIVVKKGEPVMVNAVAGKLRTTLRNAEALQDGAVGDHIKLMNLDSKEEIVGKVLGPGMVRIQIR